MSSRDYADVTTPLAVPLGVAADGEKVIVDLHLLRHLLICGVADSGKSTLVHSILNSLLARCGPERIRLIIIDPKQVEYQAYETLSYLLTPVIPDPKKTILALKWLNKESERRLKIFKETKTRSIEAYHEKIVKPALQTVADEYPEAMPYIITVIDELSIPMAAFPKEVEAAIAAIAHTARETGIHLIVTTTRLDAHTLPVALRDHFGARIAFHMTGAQSRMLIGDTGAEALEDAGAAIYRASAMKKPIALTTADITESEVDENITAIAKKYPAEAVDPALVPSEQYWTENSKTIFSTMDGDESDELYGEAVAVVREVGKASTSYLQRKMGIGYARAARLMDLMEEGGVIAPGDGAAPRQVIDQGE